MCVSASDLRVLLKLNIIHDASVWTLRMVKQRAPDDARMVGVYVYELCKVNGWMERRIYAWVRPDSNCEFREDIQTRCVLKRVIDDSEIVAGKWEYH